MEVGRIELSDHAGMRRFEIASEQDASLKPPASPNEGSPARIRERQEWPGNEGSSTVLVDYLRERRRQNAKHPETDGFPDGTGREYVLAADMFRASCDRASDEGRCTWRHVLLEEVYEAMAEEDVSKLREELVQVMAVAGRWIEALDARSGE